MTGSEGEISDYFLIMATGIQLLIGCLNCFLIYYIGKQILSSKDQKNQVKTERICLTAAWLYAINQSLVYSVALYSEPLFTMFTLLVMLSA